MATPTTEPWIEARIFYFLNLAQRAEDINALVDEDGGYLIGETVAQRLIDARQHLDRRRYTSLEQLDAIPGMGEDKIQGLIEIFSLAADDFFLGVLFEEEVLLDNWEVIPVQMSFEDEGLFEAIVHNESNFRKAATDLLHSANDHSDSHLDLILRQAYLESYPDTHLASFQFAFWFYLFDQDNWFSFELIQETIELYFSYHATGSPNIEYRQLKLYNRSPNNEITRSEIIPIIVNHPERMLTYWKVQLND